VAASIAVENNEELSCLSSGDWDLLVAKLY